MEQTHSCGVAKFELWIQKSNGPPNISASLWWTDFLKHKLSFDDEDECLLEPWIGVGTNLKDGKKAREWSIGRESIVRCLTVVKISLPSFRRPSILPRGWPSGRNILQVYHSDHHRTLDGFVHTSSSKMYP